MFKAPSGGNMVLNISKNAIIVIIIIITSRYDCYTAIGSTDLPQFYFVFIYRRKID